MKKLLALILAMMMVLSMAACGGGDEYDEAPEQQDQQEQQEQVDDNAGEGDNQEAQQPAEGIDVPVYIANATGVNIAAVYLSVTNENNWGENLMPEGYILPAQAIMGDIILHIANQDGLLWDLRVEDQEGNALVWQGLNFSQMPVSGFAVELMFDGTTPTAFMAETPDQLQGSYAAE